MKVVEAPSVSVEVMCLTLDRPASASSTGRVTWFSSSWGAAPLSVTVTTTAGKTTLGNCLMGSEAKLMTPAIVSATKSSVTGVGLRIAQAEMRSFMRRP